MQYGKRDKNTIKNKIIIMDRKSLLHSYFLKILPLILQYAEGESLKWPERVT
jgi:hypothetical protein